jgi:predicted DNA-binding transcriptional regulator AlpA
MKKALKGKRLSRHLDDGTVLLTVRQASEKFGVSRSWFYTHKEVPSLRIGRGIRYVKSDLMAFFKKQSLILE